MHWLNSFKGRIRFNEPLSRHTTLGIGGPADIWIEPSSVFELRQILGACLNKKLPFLVIGKGSNILAGDHGFKGIVSCLSSSAFTKIQSNKDCISCGAGLGVQGLLNQSEMLGLSGLEFLAGIPATVAGALVINAGNRSLGIGHFTESVTVMDGAGRMKVLDRKQLKFGYRRSNLPRFIVLEAKFKLSKSHPEEVRQKIRKFLEQKRKTQDLSAKSAGCIFKNPRYPLSAAEMIEACNLKGRGRGGAQISNKHANYFVNRSAACARDILYLMDLAQREVKKKFAVLLEPEVILL